MTFRAIGALASEIVAGIEKGTPGHTPCMEADRALARRSGEEPSAHMLTGEEPGAIVELGKMAGAVQCPRQVDKGGNSVKSRGVQEETMTSDYRERMPPALRLVVSRRMPVATPHGFPRPAAGSLMLIVDNGRGHSNVTSA